MSQPRAVDCLKLKDEVQERLCDEWRGLTDVQIRERIRRELETSPEPIAEDWRRREERTRNAPSRP